MNNQLVPVNYRIPAEWEEHRATWIVWPHQRSDWPGKFSAIPWVYVEIVRHLHCQEKVKVLIDNFTREKKVKQMLSQAQIDLEKIEFYRVLTDRGGLRDSGPMFIKYGRSEPDKLGILNWGFNGWAKYSNWKRDNAVPKKIAQLLGIEQWKPQNYKNGRPVVLEGGSIEANGLGTLMTTEECLLSFSQMRNPSLSQLELEKIFNHYMGIEKVIWLGRGIAGDDTHGHIDDLARFVNSTTIVVSVETNQNDINYEPLQDNLRRLYSATDQDDKTFRIVELPMPNPLFFKGQRLPASYANFYIANQTVLVPTFNDPNDYLALKILKNLFPDRTVIGIHSVDLVWGLGTLHCLTQQEPM